MLEMLRNLTDHLEQGGSLWDEDTDDILADAGLSRERRRNLIAALSPTR